MISSTAFPKVAFNKPPTVSPVRRESSSVAIIIFNQLAKKIEPVPSNLERGMILTIHKMKVAISPKKKFEAMAKGIHMHIE
jgi:hypothetical protein